MSSSSGSAGSRWRKAKIALGRNICVYAPRTRDDLPPHHPWLPPPPAATTPAAGSPRSTDRSSVLSAGSTESKHALGASSRRFSKSSSKSSSKNTCAICLGSTKPGHGQALFTAECSHIFHFHCIASNVKHGNQVCPVCRAKWNDIPFQAPSSTNLLQPPLPSSHVRTIRVNPTNDQAHLAFVYGLPRSVSAARQSRHASEPTTFDDDEPVAVGDDAGNGGGREAHGSVRRTVECKTYPEFSSVQRSVSLDEFTVLVNIKAPAPCDASSSKTAAGQSTRAPIDLVTVLDISGSMAGTKLALLKRAMGFVIQNLGPSDRLSVVTFSSAARRLFHLRRMSETGKLHALHAVNALVSSGGTNIAEGLKKASKVMHERKEKNAVCGIILLSDGQDTYSAASTGSYSQQLTPDGHNRAGVLPSSLSIHARSGRGIGGEYSALPIPVHAFGFGADHDATALHSISESSGGTFSFVESEGVIQDAFAQCIGGLLSVVVQDLRVKIDCVHPGVQIGSIKSGSFAVQVRDDKLGGSIQVGDLYADEERDFLVSINVPAASAASMALLKVECTYKDPVTKETVDYHLPEPLKIQRPVETVHAQMVSIEVDRQRNRLQAASAMASARAAAERGSLSDAVSVLETCRQMLAESASARAGDRLCAALDAELKEMQDRMASRQRYEESGRAYMLSGLSSQLWQRATARGDSTHSASLVGMYQTPCMTEMLQRSQTLVVPAPQNTGNNSKRSATTSTD